jgi:hypothetical protein
MLLRIFVLLLTIIYSIALQIQLGLPYLFVIGLFFFLVVFMIDQLVIQLVKCGHGSEHIRMHDTINNIFAYITKGISFNTIQE